MSPLEESYKAGVLFGRMEALSEIINTLSNNLRFMENQRLKEVGMNQDDSEYGSGLDEQRKDLP